WIQVSYRLRSWDAVPWPRSSECRLHRGGTARSSRHILQPERAPERQQMPAEPALKEARERVGPSYAVGDGPERFRALLQGWTAFAAPAVLILALALAGGGYEVTPRHIAGLAVWFVVVVLLALGAASRALLAKPFYWAAGLILSLAIFSALSSLWSGSVEISVTEADRVLIYL